MTRLTRRLRPLGLAVALALAVAPLAWDLWLAPQADAQLYQLGGTLQNAATATGNGLSLDTSQTSIVAFQVLGTFVATINFEGSLDGSTFVALTCYPVGSTAGATTATGTGIWRCNTIGIPTVRARIAAYTSGSVTVRAQAVASYFGIGTLTP